MILKRAGDLGRTVLKIRNNAGFKTKKAMIGVHL